ncbi:MULTISPECIES: glutamyl-tRNA reductase [unclassified Mucilaginibacter]|uniref:glutamyl-tRNA reductase n=1 Tax=unclassified Mucilaginibacter TaxID=2617802 RepID=UPI002AC8F9A4|nr:MULTISPECIES: glutamyl-tRNA reductase [unclassified Mucilaginibacter]MEB0262847.1 glutamyl-tRNA reductase [Mucilaginibacter sp. 10I4]MEB0277686.1 glutamyl-tRNA reductase [Mucilaginibacter sp. 10B2]MEB0301945.1 glutamyl-tRNA reductase [Mucilaginibacter sp. 5C4]WPX24687.1 glutamyl-tRNA reductase [Mucilaginibacter sp. 5C4]
MKYLKVIAFTHKHIELKELGRLVMCQESSIDKLHAVKKHFGIDEIFYLSTCNRVEFVLSTQHKVDREFAEAFLNEMQMGLCTHSTSTLLDAASIYEGPEAMNHLLRTSCSLESLIVGEKEILAQLRKAYEDCRVAGLTGDRLRVTMECVVKTAKEVYTHTNISKKPISVVSLAYRKLKDLKLCANARILIIGAGETNRNISKYLQKHKFSNFSVFNRTLSKAQQLANDLGGQAYELDELKNFKGGFDAIVTCTSAVEPILTTQIYTSLLNGDTNKKTIVDLAIPNDTAPEVLEQFDVNFIEVHSLNEIAKKNLQERYQELVHAEAIIEQNIAEHLVMLKQRKIELAMRQVPEKIKEIRNNAVNTVFAEEVQSLDKESREILEKVINYMEKKYISVPMIMAKDILINNN